MGGVKQTLNAVILKSGKVHGSKQQQHLSFSPRNRIEMKKIKKMLFRLTLMLFVYFFRIEIMNASAIMNDATINNVYAGNSDIEGVGVSVGVGDGVGRA